MLELLQATPVVTEPSTTALLPGLLKWIGGSTAAAVSFALNIVSFLLAVGGFALYFQQKREYRLLFGILEEYGLKERIASDTTHTRRRHEEAEARLATARTQIEEAKRDLEERLPAQARRAYLENTIPVVEEQIADLGHRLTAMRGDLSKYSGQAVAASPQIDRILSDAIRQHVEIRRDMETAQSNLTVLTGVAAAAGALPYFVNGVVLAPVFVVLGLLILFQSIRIYRLYRAYYRARGIRARGRRRLLADRVMRQT